MSSIIKSVAVVDQRARGPMVFTIQEPGCSLTVLKGGAFPGHTPQRQPIPRHDEYLEKLNCIKVELADAQAALKSVSRQLEQEKRELTRLREEGQQELCSLREERAVLESMQDLSVDQQSIQLLQEAEKHAAQIRSQAVENAQSAVEALRSQGYRDGLEQGAAEAREQVRAENRESVETIGRLLEELSSIKDGLVRRNEQEIVGLVLAIAEKVIGRQIQEDPKAVVDMLRNVLEQNKREEFIKITIGGDLMPAEAKVSQEVKGMLLELGHQIDVYVDSDGSPGTLVVETGKGFTDLSIRSQLEIIAESIHNA